ncbi:MAG: hydrogenase maturation protein [Polyangiaceae bacterium]
MTGPTLRILLLAHAFNGLTQRVFVELAQAGHEVTVELDIHDDVSIEAVALARPDFVIAPYLKRRIPEAIWRSVRTIVLHPGPKGDRGPSALDWAVLIGERRWGVTAFQADGEFDAGDIWASAEFDLRETSKASLYRVEVTELAAKLVAEVVARAAAGDFAPEPLDYNRADVWGRARPPMRQPERAIDWQLDDMATIVRKIRSADGAPGVADRWLGEDLHIFGGHPERELAGPAGALLGKRDEALCRACADGAVWVTHGRKRPSPEKPSLKLPLDRVLGERAESIPELEAPFTTRDGTWQELGYEEDGAVGFLRFDFHNGAMSTGQATRLLAAYRRARERPTRVLVLTGGADFFSNGLHLNVIEHAASAADESMRNIEAIDNVVKEILETTSHLTISAIGGNAGAGGVFLGLAADYVFCRDGVVLNPHYKNMGNLYGSEYWTYVLRRRLQLVGDLDTHPQVRAVMGRRLPMGAREARALGLIDEVIDGPRRAFDQAIRTRAAELAASPTLEDALADKRDSRARDEREKPLHRYRDEELARMHENFYGFDPSYHVARYNFVFKVPHSRTPLHLAAHRQKTWGRPR